MPRKTSKPANISPNYLESVQKELKSNQSKLSLVLGALIILVIGILIFNFFNKGKSDLGPAQQTEQQAQEDVQPDKLPGKYTVKEGDTLFTIAEKYYQDGFKFEEIAKANNLSDVNAIETGQVLEIPKLAQLTAEAQPSTSPAPTPEASPSPAASQAPETAEVIAPQADLGTGGGNTTIWGSKIEGDTYTVQEGDWLSTISARAYGDIFSYQKLAQANNISNPDLIIPGQVLKIPR